MSDLQLFELSNRERESAIVVVNRLKTLFTVERTEAIFRALHEGRPMLKLSDLGLTRHERVCAASVLLVLSDAVGVDGAERVVEYLAQPKACAGLWFKSPTQIRFRKWVTRVVH